MAEIYVVDYLRSPFTPPHRGALAGVRPDDLAASVIKRLVGRSGIDPAEIQDINLGCGFPEGEQGLNIARCAALIAGLPRSVGTRPSSAGAVLPCAWAGRFFCWGAAELR